MCHSWRSTTVFEVKATRVVGGEGEDFKNALLQSEDFKNALLLLGETLNVKAEHCQSSELCSGNSHTFDFRTTNDFDGYVRQVDRNQPTFHQIPSDYQ